MVKIIIFLTSDSVLCSNSDKIQDFKCKFSRQTVFYYLGEYLLPYCLLLDQVKFGKYLHIKFYFYIT